MNKDHHLTSQQVQVRYGGICWQTLYRWHTDPKSDFPRPRIIRGRKYWRIGDLEAWDAAHSATGEAA